MPAHPPHRRSHLRAVARKPITHLRRIAAALAMVICGLLAPGGRRSGRLRGDLDPEPALGRPPRRPALSPATGQPRGHPRRPGRLADHGDRGGRRRSRGHCRRRAQPGAGRPPDRTGTRPVTQSLRPGRPSAPSSPPWPLGLAGQAGQLQPDQDHHAACLTPVSRKPARQATVTQHRPTQAAKLGAARAPRHQDP
jgi:hypothetical protein